MVAYLSIWIALSGIVGIYLIVWWSLGFSEFPKRLKQKAIEKGILQNQDFISLVSTEDIEVAVGIFVVGNLIFGMVFSFLLNITNGFNWFFGITGVVVFLVVASVQTKRLIKLASSLRTLKVILQVETEK